MNIKLMEPYGYCFGVKRSLEKILEIVDEYKNQHIILIGPLVHNRNTNNLLKEKGVEIVENLDENYLLNYLSSVDQNVIIVFSCHGHYKSLENLVINRNIKFFDLSCPIVNKNTIKIKENSDKDIIFIGNKNHIESRYLFSYSNNIKENIKDCNNEILVLNQTTIEENEYNNKLEEIENNSNIEIYKNICLEPFKRYKTFKNLIINGEFDYVFVVGDTTSANTKNLLNIYQKTTNRKNIEIINDFKDIEMFNFSNIENVLVLSGTSASDDDVLGVINYLKSK